jgi:hypothetical protein
LRKYLTEDEIVQSLLGKMDDVSRATWRSVKRTDLIQGHHSNGRMIRNQYGLWDEGNPHVVFDPVDHVNHPDQMSMRIMEKVWDALNTEKDVGAKVKAGPG